MDRVRLVIGSHRWLLLAALALLSLALGTAMFSGARFSSKSANSASLAAGAIQLSSSKSGQAIVSAAGMKPGESREGMITIGNPSEVSGTVTLRSSGLSGSSALAAAIDFKVEDVTSGTTQKWSGKLSSFGDVDLGSLAASTSRNYRITLSWPVSASEASLQGTSASFTLHWIGKWVGA